MKPLSEPMRQMLREAKPDTPLPPGPVRAALMARGLVYNMLEPNKDLRCKLTAMGLSVAAQIHEEDKRRGDDEDWTCINQKRQEVAEKIARAHQELFDAFHALREPPWTEHETKMARLYRAIEALRDAA